ncbi:lipocalin family protein [Comamonas endophytica]|uniref:Outer membrane lipoprotein Blc n=1 Tax=Comamonas endophytica TaxID=2949090 RepID=A0ABY6G8Z4_9BURK|nr:MULTISPECIES: lipocalin family protein [unclassified Acidovorax]MCD2514084.1 lipocalin family protein [Acidovorax sp. D4N7]UYG51225.1 lipocalin family protein [Acidovorax sp. 5MLIR]
MSAAAFASSPSKPRTWLMALLLCSLLLACGLTARTHSATHNVAVVQNFDISRYAGPWYVLARIDHPSEAGLVQTGVYYRSNQDGSLSMVQRGLDPTSGQWVKRESLALPAGSPHEGAWKLSSQRGVASDYNVVALDDSYHWAVVKGASAARSWVLSRTPTLPADVRSELLQRARTAGINTEQLLWVPQERAVAALL